MAAVQLGRAAVEEAAHVIRGVVRHTPIVRIPEIDRLVGASVFLKVECLQATGSFKLRGIYNRLASLVRQRPDLRRVGVVTASSGNGAHALARGARLLGLPCTVFIPAPPPGRPAGVKRLAAAAAGARVRLYDRAGDDRDALVDAFASETGACIVPSSGHRDVIAGQGTVALELLGQVPALDRIVVPVAGGGLLAGTAVVAGGRPHLRVTGVEPACSNDMKLSLASGSVVRVPVGNGDSIADALLLDHPSEVALEVCLANHLGPDDVVLVDDDAIRAAMRALVRHAGLMVEPGGAAGLAALLSGAIPVARAERAGVVLTGGNVSRPTHRALVGG